VGYEGVEGVGDYFALAGGAVGVGGCRKAGLWSVKRRPGAKAPGI
jgi:hypothetical protein